MIEFIGLLEILTTINHYSLTELQTPNITVTTAHTKSSIFLSCCSVAASNGGRFPYSGFLNCPRPHLQQLSTNSTPFHLIQLNSTQLNLTQLIFPFPICLRSILMLSSYLHFSKVGSFL
jgi:hypothetical protein